MANPHPSETKTPSVSRPVLRALGPVLLLAALIGATWIATAQILVPPAVVPATAPATEFSGERAMRHLLIMAREPHTVGSPAQAQVRDYIVQQIEALGLTPVVQDTTAAIASQTGIFASNPHNILVRIPGTASTGAVGIMAHYDSQPNTPGGTDNGAAAAGMLEAIAAIQAGSRPANDLIFIFTDAEEVDAQGADAFYTQHPWARDIRAIVNFEAAGDMGASILMDMQPITMKMLDRFVRGLPHPVAYSAMPGLLTVMPIGTDMTVFTDDGVPGLSPMFGWHYRTTYHSLLEAPARMDPRSLQHQGENILGLARAFGGEDLATLKDSNGAVFFSLLPGVMVRYGTGAARPLAILAALGLVLTVALGLRKRRLTIGGIFAGLGLALLGTLLPVVLVGLAWAGLASLHPEYWRNLMGAPYAADWYLLGLVLLTCAVSLAFFMLIRRRLSVASLTAGALLLWLLPTLLTAWSLPAMSYLFVWPVLLATLVLLGLSLGPPTGPAAARGSWIWLAGLALAGALIALIVVPFALVLYMLIGFWFITMNPVLPFIAVPMLFLALMLTLFAPQMDMLIDGLGAGAAARLAGRRRWLAPALAGLLAVICLVAGTLSSGFSTAQPMPNGVWYQLDATSGEAFWYSYGNLATDPWTAQFFPGPTEAVDLSEVYAATPFNPAPPGFRGPAAVAPLAPPVLTVMSDQATSQQRTVQLHLTSPRGARGLHVKVSGAAVMAAAVNGVRHSDPAWSTRKEWHLRYYGLTPEGIDLELDVDPQSGLSVVLTDQADGLPELPGITYTPRMPDMMPFAMAQEYMPYPDTSSVSQRFDLP